MLRLLVIALALALARPAAAEDVLPPQTDRLLWCASAFYWLAGSAEDAGATKEAETYDRWSQRLLEVAGDALAASGFAPERVEELVSSYDMKVLGELGTDKARYDVVTCPELLGERR